MQINQNSLNNRCLIGIDLGATNLRVARISGKRIQQLENEKIVKSNDPSDLLFQIERMIQKIKTDHVEAIGFGVPSVVDVDEGIVYDVQNIRGWDEVPVKEIFENKFDRPVYVNNDSNCFVLGEKFFGKGRGYDTIVGLTLGSGFGSGLILNDQLYYGENCGAGEVGMLPYKKSIFEHYCSGMFFEREYGIPGEQVFKNASKGDSHSKRIYEEYGKHLANGIKAVLYAFDPQIIILGGSISRAYHYFNEAMLDGLENFAYPNSLKNLKIMVSELKEASVLGAAALAQIK